MAFLFVKNLLFPQSGYIAVSPSSPSTDRTHMDEKMKENYKPIQSIRINPRVISDATIGLSDGLTVPFALTAGLSALGDTKVVIYGGLAELIAGGISMGLGGYLGAKSEAEAYNTALSDTKYVVANDPDKASSLVRSAFDQYDFSEKTLDCMSTNLIAEPEQMVDFLMRFHHGLTEADHTAARAYGSGLTISLGYFFGGLIPLMPYLFFNSMHEAFVTSILVMALALFAFGWIKTSLLGESRRWTCIKNGFQMMVLGGVAAGAAMGCVKSIGGGS